MPCYVACLPRIAILAENLKDVGDVRCNGLDSGLAASRQGFDYPRNQFPYGW